MFAASPPVADGDAQHEVVVWPSRAPKRVYPASEIVARQSPSSSINARASGSPFVQDRLQVGDQEQLATRHDRYDASFHAAFITP